MKKDLPFSMTGNILVALKVIARTSVLTSTKTGRKSRIMKTVACVWIVLVFAYIYIAMGCLTDGYFTTFEGR